jgi:hypothetical protein
MTSEQSDRERNDVLRASKPGDELTLVCSDRRERTAEVVTRIEKGSGVVLKAEGHGTTYQLDVCRPGLQSMVSLRWPSGFAFVREVRRDDADTIWSDVTAGDIIDDLR